MIEFHISGLDDMIEYFHTDIPAEIDRLKAEVRQEFDAFAADVRLATPVGPPHRKDVAEGTLRASVRGDVTDYGDRVQMDVSVGAGTDYWMYELAREGVEPFRDAPEFERRIDETFGVDDV